MTSSSTSTWDTNGTVVDSNVLLELMSPDGYYRYLGVTKPSTLAVTTTTTTSVVPPARTESKDASTATSAAAAAAAAGGLSSVKDEEQEFKDSVKKSYRKLSLKHHPDKSGGNVDTFRLLNRAQRVLLDNTLRKQYDLLGIDLDDDDAVLDTNSNSNNHETTSTNDSSDRDDKNHHGSSSSSSSSSPQGVLQEIASNVLAGVLQLGVRTILLGVVSVVIVRYWFLVYPAYLFLLFTIYRMISMQHQQSKSNPSSIGPVSIYDTVPTSCIAIGIFLMNRSITNNSTTSVNGSTWSTQFWIGEGLVTAMFIYNSLSGMAIIQSLKPTIVWTAITILSALIALWFRGSFWNYIIVIVIIAITALLVAMAFPIMELIVETILNEKLRKIGEKVRHHHQVLHTYYEKKYHDKNSSRR